MDLADRLAPARQGALVLEEWHGGGGHKWHGNQGNEGEHVRESTRGDAPVQVHGMPGRKRDA